MDRQLRSWFAPKKLFKLLIILILIIIFSLPILVSANSSERWLSYGKDKSSRNSKYYYDSESVRYFPDNHVSVWTKAQGFGGEKFTQTEISCSGSLFRTVQAPPKDHWDRILKKESSKTMYVVSGWIEIPPDSEVNTLKQVLCNNSRKSWN